MKQQWLVCLLAGAVFLPALAQSQGTDYQTGKIVKVVKLPDATPSGGTDAPTTAPTDRYDVSIQIGDTVYVCRYKTVSGEDLAWIQGEEGLVKVKGKTMYVKRASGKDARASVLHTTKAD